MPIKVYIRSLRAKIKFVLRLSLQALQNQNTLSTLTDEICRRANRKTYGKMFPITSLFYSLRAENASLQNRPAYVIKLSVKLQWLSLSTPGNRMLEEQNS
jgi:hypothetical protein